MNFPQNYKIERPEGGQDQSLFQIFATSNQIFKEETIAPKNRLQFHVEPLVSKKRLLALLDSVNSSNASNTIKIQRSYNSIKVFETLSFQSQGHQVNFPLSLTIHLPELSLNKKELNFNQVFYGSSKTIELTLTNKSKFCNSWYDIHLNDTINFGLSENSGELRPGESVRVSVTLRPDGSKLSYFGELVVKEMLIGKIEEKIGLSGVAVFDSKGIE